MSEHETRGYVVRSFTAADIVDAIDLRGVLEGLALRRVTERGASKSLLRELRACLEDGDAIRVVCSIHQIYFASLPGAVSGESSFPPTASQSHPPASWLIQTDDRGPYSILSVPYYCSNMPCLSKEPIIQSCVLSPLLWMSLRTINSFW